MPETKIPPTQQFVAVKKIKDGVVYLKRGGLRRVIIVSGINFDLKSEDEQNLILASFQDFLNTLDFSLQFFVHSRKVNVDVYLERMKERKEKEENELLKIQIDEYIRFIKMFVDQNNIISKTFFVVVPYDTFQTVESAKGFLSFLGSKKRGQDEAERRNEQEHLQQLAQRVDDVLQGLSQIGLRGVPLEDEELTELFYNLYNPELIEKKELEIAKKE